MPSGKHDEEHSDTFSDTAKKLFKDKKTQQETRVFFLICSPYNFYVYLVKIL